MPTIREELRRRTALSRPTVRMRTARVVRAVDLTPRMRRVVLDGDDLADLAGGLPADAWKFMLPPPGHDRVELPVVGPDGVPGYPEGAAVPVLRALTVRRFDAAAGELTVDVFVHGASPAGDWARSARPGSSVALAGPRHSFFASPEADWYLFAGDETALPAVAAALESLPATARAVALVETADESDRVEIGGPAAAEVVWLHRRGTAAAGSRLLEKAVRGLDLPFDGAQAWLAGEAGVVRAVRRHLLDERGLTRDRLHAAAYWKEGHTSDQRDVEVLAAYQEALERGGDQDDPQLTLEAELA
ncbi:siderophore-interacting protein [Streptomyces sp. NPDC050560]|uniref:siderophore-interacting protein n=1 Tax=Streptomyces sp. NPDC050560 TaxID=3365630 RepID=UPI0037A641BC